MYRLIDMNLTYFSIHKWIWKNDQHLFYKKLLLLNIYVIKSWVREFISNGLLIGFFFLSTTNQILKEQENILKILAMEIKKIVIFYYSVSFLTLGG